MEISSHWHVSQGHVLTLRCQAMFPDITLLHLRLPCVSSSMKGRRSNCPDKSGSANIFAMTASGSRYQMLYPVCFHAGECSSMFPEKRVRKCFQGTSPSV